MNPIRKILVPVDFSPCSEAAASYAVELGQKLDAQVTLFNAYFVPVSVPFPDGSAYIPTPEAMAELASAAEHELRALRDRLEQKTGLQLPISSAEGPAKEIIPRVAREGGYDLIVLGTHGRTGLAHLVLGSVAEAVVRTATCPVLTVRESKAAAKNAA
jgi:nucleotide-binding universal stress UspA family protein